MEPLDDGLKKYKVYIQQSIIFITAERQRRKTLDGELKK